jgi:hypothetical protein
MIPNRIVFDELKQGVNNVALVHFERNDFEF